MFILGTIAPFVLATTILYQYPGVPTNERVSNAPSVDANCKADVNVILSDDCKIVKLPSEPDLPWKLAVIA